MPETAAQESKALETEALTVIQRAQIVKITNQDSYNQATTILLEEIKPFRKRWAEYWEPLRKSAHDAYQGVLSKFNAGDKPLEAAERTLKAEINRWDAEQERIRHAEQRRAQEEAERIERERRLQEAVLAEEAGVANNEVEAILNAPVTVAPPVIGPTYQKATGISRRENWKCRVTDMKALCRAVGAGKVPIEYVLPNEAALNARAKADKGTLNIPGCTAFNDPIIAGRSSR